MGKLIYGITTSLDGFVADENGNFDWAMPSEEVHALVNDVVRNVGTSLLGRKMYEVLKIWDRIPTEGTNELMDGPSEAMNDYAQDMAGGAQGRFFEHAERGGNCQHQHRARV